MGKNFAVTSYFLRKKVPGGGGNLLELRSVSVSGGYRSVESSSASYSKRHYASVGKITLQIYLVTITSCPTIAEHIKGA